MRLPIRAMICAVGLAPLLAGTQAAGPDLADRLAQHGIRPVEPPSPATDFTLPRLDGGEASLSDSRGRWVVLTFFATWCGPCVSEMPSLERLYRERGERGVTVLGVSIDESRDPLEPFVKKLDLSFPILWDPRGQSAALYRASSIPVSYLIDPQGRIVGVSRGARDWSALTGLMDSALEWMPPGEAGGSSYDPGGGVVSLPSEFDPPTAAISHFPSEPRAGRPFFLDVKLNWAGTFEDYMLQPPHVTIPEGVRQEGVSASSSTEAGRNVVTYRVTLLADEAGSFALDPVEVRYIPRFESQPVATRVKGPTVVVRPFTVAGLSPPLLAGVAVAVALAGLVLFGLVRLSRARKSRKPSPDVSGYDRLRDALDRARKLRIAGDVAGAVSTFCEIESELCAAGGGPADPELRAMAEQVRYGGQVPPSEVVDTIQRRLEKGIESLRPDPGRAERDSIRLRDQTRQGA
jgi:peroxiredoxin